MYPMPVRYRNEDKVGHLLKWAAGWEDESPGESLWSYSLRLGGSHALLNGWLKNPKLLSALTHEERKLLDEARRRASNARRRTLAPTGA